MELMTQALWQHLPPLDSQKALSNPLVSCHFYLPDTQWDWFMLEFDGIEVFYGWASHMIEEFGTFYLSELRILRGLQGMPVLRERHFTPRPLVHVQQQYTSRFPLVHTHAQRTTLQSQQSQALNWKANTLHPAITPTHI